MKLVFMRKEYRPAQRVLAIRKWLPFIRLVNAPRWFSKNLSVAFVAFEVLYMKTRSFHAFKAFGRIVYFRRVGE